MEEYSQQQQDVERLCMAGSDQMLGLMRYGRRLRGLCMENLRVHVESLPGATKWTTYIPTTYRSKRERFGSLDTGT